ncbi:MAG TPA: hypothetical protein VJQ83_05910 [Tepidiformaceae bacterium]|nr:hypothetical protein [Tepidiformaceae bacterium]
MTALVCVALAVGIWVSTASHAEESPTTRTERCTAAQVQRMIDTGIGNCAGHWSAYSPSDDLGQSLPTAMPESTAISGG